MISEIRLAPALDIYLQMKNAKAAFISNYKSFLARNAPDLTPTGITGISEAFYWMNTPEGYNYWYKIREEYLSLTILDVDSLYTPNLYVKMATIEQLTNFLRIAMILGRTWNSGNPFNDEEMTILLTNNINKGYGAAVCYSKGFWCRFEELSDRTDSVNYEDIILSREL